MNTLVCAAIGDALGMPFETLDAEAIETYHWTGNYVPSIYHKLRAGQWTDDTQMTVALAKALLEAKGLKPEIAARHYLEWYNNGPRGIGKTTKQAMENLKDGATWNESGIFLKGYCGNGTAMRASPIGIVYRNAVPSKIFEVCSQDTIITHYHEYAEADYGSAVVAYSVAKLLTGTKPSELHFQISSELLPLFESSNVTNKILDSLDMLKDFVPPQKALPALGLSGDVAETVATALYCVAYADNFKEAIMEAIKIGGDTDTRACIAGAILGSCTPLDKIPGEWLQGLEEREMLSDLNSQLMNLVPEV